MTPPTDSNEPQPGYGELPANADAALKGSFAALRRAALRARQVARQTGTDLIVVRNGQLVCISPEGELLP